MQDKKGGYQRPVAQFEFFWRWGFLCRRSSANNRRSNYLVQFNGFPGIEILFPSSSETIFFNHRQLARFLVGREARARSVGSCRDRVDISLFSLGFLPVPPDLLFLPAPEFVEIAFARERKSTVLKHSVLSWT